MVAGIIVGQDRAIALTEQLAQIAEPLPADHFRAIGVGLHGANRRRSRGCRVLIHCRILIAARLAKSSCGSTGTRAPFGSSTPGRYLLSLGRYGRALSQRMRPLMTASAENIGKLR